mmetsp:Transcript_5439/g.8930  ORF Transcript_5439/g.8930 Transcript_5439/m.8930 type:complete len:560 (-) Transcript_5439:2908-4587(-)
MKASLLLLSFLSITGASINLPVNDINIVVVTDVHSWVAGHKRHEPQWDADYGHVLSFYEQLKKEWYDQNLLFLMNGDFTDGTGLSAYPPSDLTNILIKMPWDALNVGNHELYRNSTIENIIHGGFSDYWGSKYVTSNVLRADNSKPQQHEEQLLGGSKYLIWNGPSANVLIFGFLYDMIGNAALATVIPVEQVIEQAWFTDVLLSSTAKYDAIVCMVHMDFEDSLISVLLQKIRSTIGAEMPVQFISGHTHIRAYTEVDNCSTSFEAGHYLDTVGFVSFDKKGKHFQHVFIEANVEELQSVAGVDDLMTENGRQLQHMIRQTQEEMGLLQRLGCSPDHYFVESALSHPQSLWKLFMDKVINGFYFDGSSTSVLAMGNGGFRYDLFAGNVTLDDIVSVSPFNDTILKVTSSLKGSDLLEVFGGGLNNSPNYICSARTDAIDPDETYELYTIDFDLAYFVERVQSVTQQQVKPVAQNMAITKLWVDFVSNEWQEESHCGATAAPVSPVLLVIVGLAVAVVLLLVVVVVVATRRRAVQGYDVATEVQVGSTSEDLDDDNELI